MLIHKPRAKPVRFIREAFYTFYNPLKKLYWKVCKPEGVGVKSFIFNQDKILLVRIGYMHKSWVLPGGAVDTGEKPQDAAMREVQEESGLVISDLEFVESTYYSGEDKRLTLYYYYGTTNQEDITIDDQEIVDAGWFALDALPQPRRPKIDKEIALYNNWKYGKS